MNVVCEQCRTTFVLADELVSENGTAVQCTRCQHQFLVWPAGVTPVPMRWVQCPRCSTRFALAESLIPPQGAPVQCSRCHLVFVLPSVAARAEGRFIDPADPTRHSVMLFGSAPRPPAGASPLGASPPRVEVSNAEAYRSDHGRMVFGWPPPVAQPAPPATPHHNVMFFGARPSPGLTPNPPAPPPPQRTFSPGVWPRSPLQSTDADEAMLERGADHPEDEAHLRVLSDALMEQNDPRGRLISLQLEEELGSDLMRKVKVNVIARDHGPGWSPPGARILSFHRGFASDLEWTGETDPEHVAWRSARHVRCTMQQVPSRSVFDVQRPNLRRVSGLHRPLLRHVFEARPPNLEELDGAIHRDELLQGELATQLERFPRLRRVSLRTTQLEFDRELSPLHLRSFLSRATRLERVRLTMPFLPFLALETACAVAPSVLVQFIVPFTLVERQYPLVLEPRTATLRAPANLEGLLFHEFVNDLSNALGRRLTVVKVAEDD